MSSVAWDEKAAVLAHYQRQAAQAAFDNLAEPECSDADEELDAMRNAIEIAQCHLRSALSAIDRNDLSAASQYVDYAVAEFVGKK